MNMKRQAGSNRMFIGSITSILALLLILFVVFWTYDGRYHVASIDVGHGRRIIISTEWFSDAPAMGLYYQIDDGQAITPRCFFDAVVDLPPKHAWQVIEDSSRSIGGLIRDDRPDCLLVMHDVATGESWPRGSRPKMLLAPLRNTHHLRNLITSDEFRYGDAAEYA